MRSVRRCRDDSSGRSGGSWLVVAVWSTGSRSQRTESSIVRRASCRGWDIMPRIRTRRARHVGQHRASLGLQRRAGPEPQRGVGEASAAGRSSRRSHSWTPGGAIRRVTRTRAGSIRSVTATPASGASIVTSDGTSSRARAGSRSRFCRDQPPNIGPRPLGSASANTTSALTGAAGPWSPRGRRRARTRGTRPRGAAGGSPAGGGRCGRPPARRASLATKRGPA